MVGKTYPELTELSGAVQDADVLAAYRSPGPLRRLTAASVQAYMQAPFAADGGADLVGFLQSGTDAVAVTLQEKLREGAISVTDFGLVPTTTTITNAFTAAAAQGRPLWFPAGTYTFSPSTTIDITGIPYIDGDAAIINAAGATSGNLFRADGTLTLLASAVAISNGGSITVTISTSDLTIGDVLLVVSNETTPATSETSSARKGQRVTVASNNGTTILVTPPLLDDYTAAYLYRSDENPIHVGSGLTFIGDPATASQRTCLFLNFCNARVEAKFRGFTAAACTFTNSQGSFTGTSQGMPNTLGLGYGVSCDDLSDVVVSAVITASRHCVKGGGGGYWTQAMVGGVSGAISFPGRLSVAGGIYFGHILQAIDAHATMEVLSVGSGVICGPIVSFARFTQVNGVRMYVDGTTVGGGQAMILGSRAAAWCDYQIDGLSIEFFGTMPQNTPIIYAPGGTYGGRNLSIRNLSINGVAFSSTSGLRRAVYIGGTWTSVDIDGVRVKYDSSVAPALELQCSASCDYRISRFSTDGRQIIVKAMQNGAKVRFVEPAISACAQIALDFQVDAAATNGYTEVEVINPRIESGPTASVSAIKIAKSIRANVNGGFVRGNNGDAIEALLTQRLTVRDVDLTDNTGNYVAQTDYGTGSTLFEVGNDIRGSAAADLGAGVTVYLQNTVTVDPASLATGASTTIATISVTGASVGDLVDASFSLDLAGAEVVTWVSAANTVSYFFTNVNGTNPLDLGSGTLKVRVRK